MLEEKARSIATEAHKGTYRKDGVTPVITHPEAVVELLKSVGVTDQDILCAALLHDTIEDCGLTAEFIECEFNQRVAGIVKALTRDVGREEYKQRIKESDYAVQIVKLADTAHNCKSLFEGLPQHTIRRKVEDCKAFYIPLADKICPEISKLLLEYIKPLDNK